MYQQSTHTPRSTHAQHILGAGTPFITHSLGRSPHSVSESPRQIAQQNKVSIYYNLTNINVWRVIKCISTLVRSFVSGEKSFFTHFVVGCVCVCVREWAGRYTRASPSCLFSHSLSSKMFYESSATLPFRFLFG